MTIEDDFVMGWDYRGREQTAIREAEEKRKRDIRANIDASVKHEKLSTLIMRYVGKSMRLNNSKEFEGVRRAARRGEIETAFEYDSYQEVAYEVEAIRREIDIREERWNEHALQAKNKA